MGGCLPRGGCPAPCLLRGGVVPSVCPVGASWRSPWVCGCPARVCAPCVVVGAVVRVGVGVVRRVCVGRGASSGSVGVTGSVGVVEPPEGVQLRVESSVEGAGVRVCRPAPCRAR